MQSKHWKDVYKLWAQWMFYEAAERGYDHKAASAASREYYKAKELYELFYGETWNEDKEVKE